MLIFSALPRTPACHPERKGPQTFFSLGVVREGSAVAFPSLSGAKPSGKRQVQPQSEMARCLIPDHEDSGGFLSHARSFVFPRKRQTSPVRTSAGEDARTTADLEIGDTVSSKAGRQRRLGAKKQPRIPPFGRDDSAFFEGSSRWFRVRLASCASGSPRPTRRSAAANGPRRVD